MNRKSTQKWFCHKAGPILIKVCTYCPDYVCYKVVYFPLHLNNESTLVWELKICVFCENSNAGKATLDKFYLFTIIVASFHRNKHFRLNLVFISLI